MESPYGSKVESFVPTVKQLFLAIYAAEIDNEVEMWVKYLFLQNVKKIMAV
jgi:hypothetical protein